MNGQPHTKCPTSDLWGYRHLVTARHWTLTTPAGETVTLCSAACTVSWLCHALPADLDANAQDSDGTAESEAA